jgi:hypothetical protein
MLAQGPSTRKGSFLSFFPFSRIPRGYSEEERERGAFSASGLAFVAALTAALKDVGKAATLGVRRTSVAAHLEGRKRERVKREETSSWRRKWLPGLLAFGERKTSALRYITNYVNLAMSTYIIAAKY